MSLERFRNLEPWSWPEGIDQEIVNTLTDPNAPEPERCLAASMAGDYVVVNEATVAALLSVVDDPTASEELRAAAAIAFGAVLETVDMEGFDEFLDAPISEMTFVRIQKTLRRTHSDETNPVVVRRRALEASVRAQEDWHSAAVAQGWQSSDQNWRLTAMFAMRYVNGFEQEILAGLTDEHLMIRHHAILAAGASELRAAWPHIEQLLTDQSTDRDLLLAAIEAAASVHPTRARPYLDEFACSKDEEIQALAEGG